MDDSIRMDSGAQLFRAVALDSAIEDARNKKKTLDANMEELKHMEQCAKETNDMHAKEVHAQKTALATAMEDLQFRASCMLDEGDESLAALDEDCEERLLKEKLELYDEDTTEDLEPIIHKTEYGPYDGCVWHKSKGDTIFKSYQKHQKKKAMRKLNEELITEAVKEYEKHGCDALHGIPYTSYKSK
uniref:Uncharacterized protein n=1 Tax=Tanacetum cinerariifolium TaxID=118510 RepID=A0A6L2KTR4_TANCI|nr:hypothetical protein [Tanacetum cinerariifolium]